MFDLVEVPFFFFLHALSRRQSEGPNVGIKPRLINIDKEREGMGREAVCSPAPVSFLTTTL